MTEHGIPVYASDPDGAFMMFWIADDPTTTDFNDQVYHHFIRPEYNDNWFEGVIAFDTVANRWAYDGHTLYPTREEAEAHQ